MKDGTMPQNEGKRVIESKPPAVALENPKSRWGAEAVRRALEPVGEKTKTTEDELVEERVVAKFNELMSGQNKDFQLKVQKLVDEGEIGEPLPGGGWEISDADKIKYFSENPLFLGIRAEVSVEQVRLAYAKESLTTAESSGELAKLQETVVKLAEEISQHVNRIEGTKRGLRNSGFEVTYDKIQEQIRQSSSAQQKMARLLEGVREQNEKIGAAKGALRREARQKGDRGFDDEYTSKMSQLDKQGKQLHDEKDSEKKKIRTEAAKNICKEMAQADGGSATEVEKRAKDLFDQWTWHDAQIEIINRQEPRALNALSLENSNVLARYYDLKSAADKVYSQDPPAEWKKLFVNDEKLGQRVMYSER